VTSERNEEKWTGDAAKEEGSPLTEPDIAGLQTELAAALAKAEINLAGWQRAQADFANYRKRAEQEKSETVRYASAELITRLLPVLDDIDRALAEIPEDIKDKPWVKGVKLIEENMLKILGAQGLKTIDCTGEAFDPALHEALTTCPGREGVVMQQVAKGYIYNNRLLRPARVIVGCGEGNGAGTEKEA